MGLDVEGDFRAIFNVFQRAEEMLRNICLDGVFRPRNPSDAGLPWAKVPRE
jgi:hypothetical protein